MEIIKFKLLFNYKLLITINMLIILRCTILLVHLLYKQRLQETMS